MATLFGKYRKSFRCIGMTDKPTYPKSEWLLTKGSTRASQGFGVLRGRKAGVPSSPVCVSLCYTKGKEVGSAAGG